jgi:hypothetical protein
VGVDNLDGALEEDGERVGELLRARRAFSSQGFGEFRVAGDVEEDKGRVGMVSHGGGGEVVSLGSKLQNHRRLEVRDCGSGGRNGVASAGLLEEELQLGVLSLELCKARIW